MKINTNVWKIVLLFASPNFRNSVIILLKFFEDSDNICVSWQIINEIIERKTNNIDDNLIRYFRNRNINELIMILE